MGSIKSRSVFSIKAEIPLDSKSVGNGKPISCFISKNFSFLLFYLFYWIEDIKSLEEGSGKKGYLLIYRVFFFCFLIDP